MASCSFLRLQASVSKLKGHVSSSCIILISSWTWTGFLEHELWKSPLCNSETHSPTFAHLLPKITYGRENECFYPDVYITDAVNVPSISHWTSSKLTLMTSSLQAESLLYILFCGVLRKVKVHQWVWKGTFGWL